MINDSNGANSADNGAIPSSQDVFAEAFAAATNSEPESTTDLQDISSGTEVEQEVEEDISSPEPEVDSSESDTKEPETSEGLSESVKEISVKGKDGKRRNIKVDFSDHDRMTKYVQKAANAVRLQSERDALQAQVAKLSEANTAMENLQSVIDNEGFEGLINHLNADNGGFEAWKDQMFARHELRMNASEDELARLDAEDNASKLQRRLDLLERQQAEREERINNESAKAERDRQQSEVNPIYFKYTFDGKLGDSVAEQRHNKAMFREVTRTLDELSEEGVKITPKVIEREFKAYATPLLKGVNRKVRQNTKRAMDKKKAEATAHAQTQARKGYSEDSISKAMESKNWTKSLADMWVKGKL